MNSFHFYFVKILIHNCNNFNFLIEIIKFKFNYIFYFCLFQYFGELKLKFLTSMLRLSKDCFKKRIKRRKLVYHNISDDSNVPTCSKVVNERNDVNSLSENEECVRMELEDSSDFYHDELINENDQECMIDSVSVREMDNECMIDQDIPYSNNSDPQNDISKLKNFIKINQDPRVTQCLKDFLQKWVAEFQISQTAATALFRFIHNIFPELPIDARTVSNSLRKVTSLDCAPGTYSHAGIKNNLDRLLNSEIVIPKEIFLDFNIDGLPIFKNSTENACWVISGRAHSMNSGVFLIGAYVGTKKPENFANFLKPFVDELQSMKQLYVFKGQNVSVRERCYILDSPARASVCGTAQYNAKNGCNRCMIVGRFINGRMSFYSETIAEKRTNENFRARVDPEYHHFKSPLERCESLDMVSQVVNDPFHLLYLGVTKNLLNKWFGAGKSISKGLFHSSLMDPISKNLILLNKFQPCEFQRHFQDLQKFSSYKGTELRSFLLYSGPVVLLDRIPKEHYDLFMVLHVAVRILNDVDLFLTHNSIADNMLKYFINEYARMYGEEFVVQNIHALSHLADNAKDVKAPLDDFTSFPFESYLCPVKELVRSHQKPLEQIVKRLDEINKSSHIESIKKPVPLKHLILSGKLPDNTFKTLFFHKYKLDTSEKNSFVLTKDQRIFNIRGFIPSPEISAKGCYVMNVESFFSTPLESSKLKIYKTNTVYEAPTIIDVSLFERKMFKMVHSNFEFWIFYPMSKFESTIVSDY